MRTILFLAFIFILSLTGTSQGVQYQTYTASLVISGTKDGSVQEWENKDISVTLNYQDGNFQVMLYNTDFYDKSEPNAPDTITNQIQYYIKGIFPIDDILNQQTNNQDYNVELQLINDAMMLNVTMNFDMNITLPNPGGSGRNYRIFVLNGIMYNDQTNLAAFEGFDNEINIQIVFNGFMTQ